MYSSIAEIYPYLVYAAPPLVGAFIGYLTNRVAIRMLFRPLKAWHIGRLKIPMTPGVIPSKRHELAANIGEMVGEHLLTGDEISRALQKEGFQEHLQILIESKISSTMKKDLGSLKTIIPPSYRSYFDIAEKTARYRLKETIHDNLRSENTGLAIEAAVDRWLDSSLAKKIDDLLPDDMRGLLFENLAEAVAESLSRGATREHLATMVAAEIRNFADTGKACSDVLPNQAQDAIMEAVRAQTPRLLGQAAALLKEPEVKDKIVDLVLEAINEFVETLGPMSTMVKGFLDSELLDDKIRHYLDEKHGDIEDFFHDETIEIRVRAALGERIGYVLATPLTDLLRLDDEQQIDAVSRLVSEKILLMLNINESRQLVVQFLEESFNNLTAAGNIETGRVLEQAIGGELVNLYKGNIKRSVAAAIYSTETLRIIDQMIDDLVGRLVDKPIGRLDHLIPHGVTEGLCRSVKEMTTRLLISEVPGVVKSINFNKIVTDRIDSFDLLRLEQLLLSIMAEQFKYINLFGALLGFLIGCANLLFIVGGNL